MPVAIQRSRSEVIGTGEEAWHGTRNGYVYHGCGCELCKAANRAYKDEHPRAFRSYKTQGRYGLTRAECDKLFDDANGICAICKRHCDKLNIDHDHRTGNVRGLLCDTCNWGLGHFKDNPLLLDAASRYLFLTDSVPL